MCQHALPKLAQISAPLPKVGVLHGLKVADVLFDDLPECPLGPLTRFDAPANLLAQGPVVEHGQIGIEERALLSVKPILKLGAKPFDVRPRRTKGPAKELKLLRHIVALLIGNGLEGCRGKEHHGRTVYHPWRPGNAREARIPALAPAASEACHAPGGLGMGNDARQLGRQGHQEGFLAGVKATLKTLLDHQDSQHSALVDDGHPEKGVVGLFPNFLEVAKARVMLSVVKV